MIIADLNYLENTSEVIGDLCGGNTSAFAGGLVLATGGRAFTNLNLKTYVFSSPFVSVGLASAVAVAVVSVEPSLPGPT